MSEKIEDTYAEAFDGIYCRVIVTADDEEILRKAAEDATATPSIVIGRTEGGIEKWLSEHETPDGRKGVILQFWGGIDERKPIEESVKKFEIELSYRIRQDILVKPFTALFDASINPAGKLDMMERVGHCGDGYEWEEQRYGRKNDNCPNNGSRLPNRTIFGLWNRHYGSKLLVHVQNEKSGDGCWKKGIKGNKPS